jgi:hypothetical protein
MVECEPFFRYVLHDGIARAGRADLIADLCRDWQVFLDAGETSWPENWNGGTRCHGWSSTPTRDLIVHVLGITPFEPGYDEVLVAPSWWPDGPATVPTPTASVTVEAHADGRVRSTAPSPSSGLSPSPAREGHRPQSRRPWRRQRPAPVPRGHTGRHGPRVRR